MSVRFRRSLIAVASVLLAFGVSPARAATLDGVPALPGGAAAVTGRLVAGPTDKGEALDFVLTRIGDSKPITGFDVELTKQLHVIAVSDDLTIFLHDHVTQVAKDGHFRLTMRFPHQGLYHIYADAVPSGLGQQVLRFDLAVGSAGAARSAAALKPTGLIGKDGPYSVRFDSLDLVAGKESLLTLHIDKDGKPASDVHPFLGVAAHAVLIRRDDLIYVHVHAAPADSQSPQGMAGMAGMQDMPGMGSVMPGNASIDPTLALHVAPPAPGLYALWIQFIAGTRVRTVPFVLAVK